MRYTSQFKDYDNNDIYYVTIDTHSNPDENKEINLSFDTPVVINYDDPDNIFEPIKTYSATLSIVDKQYLMDIYNTGYNVDVLIENDSNNILFYGYVTPNVYSQDWNNVSVIDVECISPVAMLKYSDYTTIGTTRETVSIYSILQHILWVTAGYQIVYFPKHIGFDNHAYSNGFSDDQSILDDLYLDEQNFFDDDEDETPWKMYEVLEEICKFLGITLVENNDVIWMIDYANLNDYIRIDLSRTTNRYYDYNPSSTITITKDLYGGGNNSLSLENVYRNIKFEANTYPYEKIFPDILDADDWVLDNDVYRGRLNTAELPSLYPVTLTAGKKKDQKWWLCYWFYFTSSRMTFYEYTTDSTTHEIIPYALPDGTNQIMELKPGRQGKMNVIGASLMKYGNYEITNPTVVASLDWTPAIVINSGYNRFNISDYRIDSTHYNWQQLKSDLGQHETNMLAHENSRPKYPILEVVSDNDIIITDKSYLVISGSGLISDTPFEDPGQEEWKGKDDSEKEAFENGHEYAINLNDQPDDKDKRYYVGHPLFYMSISIGKWVLNESVHTKTDEEENEYQEITYEWYDTTNADDVNPWITIPVGSKEFSFYKSYDITNTCDWRLGLDNKKGFCIPLDNGLNGKLKVSIYGPVSNLICGPYLQKPTNLPNVETDISYTVDYDPITKEPLYNWTITSYGTVPNYAIIKKLKVEVCPVKYYTISDLLEKNSDNKKTDHVYENLISMSNVEEFESISLKINTQDPAKDNSFSSIKKLGDNGFEYIEQMTVDGQNYKIQEENLVDKYTSHYGNIKTKFKADLKHNHQNPVTPATQFIQPLIKNGTTMATNGYEWDLKAGTDLISMVEI